MRKGIVVFLLMLFFAVGVYAENAVFVVTGQSHASLYPCGRCPAAVGGGVARRAEVIKSARGLYKNVLLLDSGDVFAGGNLDDASLSQELDKERTDSMMRVMKNLQYDAVGVGESEFYFGKEFFEKIAKTYAVPFVSCNIPLKSVRPYILKKSGNLKIAILGISPEELKNKSGIDILPVRASLEKTISQLNAQEKPNYVILISTLGQERTKQLLGEIKGINLAIVGGFPPARVDKEEVGETTMLFPVFQGKMVSVVNAEFDQNNLWKTSTFTQERLSLDKPEDTTVKNLLPLCYKDQDCPRKEGYASKCQNPGAKAKCTYKEHRKFQATVLSVLDCKECSIQLTQNLLKSVFPGIQFTLLDYRDTKAAKILEDFSLRALPAFILPQEIEQEEVFSKASQLFKKINNAYLLEAPYSGIFLFLNRKAIPGKIDLFFDIYDKKSIPVLNQLKSILEAEKDKKVKIYFIFPLKDNKISDELPAYVGEEYMRIFAVEKLFPDKLWDYLVKRIESIESSWWQKPMQELGIDQNAVSVFSQSGEGEKALQENIAMLAELGASAQPAMLIDNQRIFSLSLQAQDGDKTLKNIFQKK